MDRGVVGRVHPLWNIPDSPGLSIPVISPDAGGRESQAVGVQV